MEVEALRVPRHEVDAREGALGVDAQEGLGERRRQPGLLRGVGVAQQHPAPLALHRRREDRRQVLRRPARDRGGAGGRRWLLGLEVEVLDDGRRAVVAGDLRAHHLELVHDLEDQVLEVRDPLGPDEGEVAHRVHGPRDVGGAPALLPRRHAHGVGARGDAARARVEDSEARLAVAAVGEAQPPVVAEAEAGLLGGRGQLQGRAADAGEAARLLQVGDAIEGPLGDGPAGGQLGALAAEIVDQHRLHPPRVERGAGGVVAPGGEVGLVGLLGAGEVPRPGEINGDGAVGEADARGVEVARRRWGLATEEDHGSRRERPSALGVEQRDVRRRHDEPGARRERRGQVLARRARRVAAAPLARGQQRHAEQRQHQQGPPEQPEVRRQARQRSARGRGARCLVALGVVGGHAASEGGAHGRRPS